MSSFLHNSCLRAASTLVILIVAFSMGCKEKASDDQSDADGIDQLLDPSGTRTPAPVCGTGYQTTAKEVLDLLGNPDAAMAQAKKALPEALRPLGEIIEFKNEVAGPNGKTMPVEDFCFEALSAQAKAAGLSVNLSRESGDYRGCIYQLWEKQENKSVLKKSGIVIKKDGQAAFDLLIPLVTQYFSEFIVDGQGQEMIKFARDSEKDENKKKQLTGLLELLPIIKKQREVLAQAAEKDFSSDKKLLASYKERFGASGSLASNPVFQHFVLAEMTDAMFCSPITWDQAYKSGLFNMVAAYQAIMQAQVFGTPWFNSQATAKADRPNGLR